jgi:uncharacterized protein (DUF2235 family)
MPNQWIVLFDGTGNTPDDDTNVTEICKSLEGDDAWRKEHVFYDSGVGTEFLGKFTGLAAGRGLSENIEQGYQFLSSRYQPGDQIFIFGFSRGAFTARSLVGLISKVGILRKGESQLVHAAYNIYRNKDLHADSPVVQEFRLDHSHPYDETRVRFVGVWDTVGALGIPWHLSVMPFGRDDYSWHNTSLSPLVDYAYHACAIDEHREDFDVTLWTEAGPRNLGVEQRWFPGAHCNVGGGYGEKDLLPEEPLRWMQEKAQAAGLKFSKLAGVAPDAYLTPIRDSFKEFLGGVYAATRLGKSFYRPHRDGVNQVIDPSAWFRWGKDASYRPPFLQGLAPVAVPV